MRILLLLFPFWLWAESYLVSNIPLPKTYVQNLDIEVCDKACLEQYLKYGEIFSFLAHADRNIADEKLNEARLIHISLFNLGSRFESDQLRIAILLPHRQIGRYAHSTTNALFAYLLSQNSDYEIKSFYIEDESLQSITDAIATISDEGYQYLLAPLTLQGTQHLVSVPNNLTIYIPTINRSDVNTTASNIYFGGIDYRAQTETLMEHVNDPLVIFYDESRLGTQLKEYARDAYVLYDDTQNTELKPGKKIYSYGINQKSSNLKYPLHNNEKLEWGSFLLNTPVVKSGMIMSQITLYDVNATNILSTQINYDPLIFTMTQYHDRKNMIIANSINLHNSVITETNALLNNDINYDWINYATTVGTDYFYFLATSNEREYPLEIHGDQIDYPINLVRPGYAKFSAVGE